MSMRRLQGNATYSFKIMDVEEPELEIAVMGFCGVAPECKTKKACNKTEAWQKHCSRSYRSRCVKASHHAPHILHANAIDTLQKRHTYTLYVACITFLRILCDCYVNIFL